MYALFNEKPTEALTDGDYASLLLGQVQLLPVYFELFGVYEDLIWLWLQEGLCIEQTREVQEPSLKSPHNFYMLTKQCRLCRLCAGTRVCTDQCNADSDRPNQC